MEQSNSFLDFCAENNINAIKLDKKMAETVISKCRNDFLNVDDGGFRIKKGLKAIYSFQCLDEKNFYMFCSGSSANWRMLSDVDPDVYFVKNINLSQDWYINLFEYIVDINFNYFLYHYRHIDNGFYYYERY
jgi:hypothetical protein